MTLKSYLKERGLSQKFIAAETGIDPGRICLHVNRRMYLPEKHQVSLAIYLGITLQELKELSRAQGIVKT